MKVVVTGGSGFLGAKLVSTLRDAGHEVLSAIARPTAFAPDRNPSVGIADT